MFRDKFMIKSISHPAHWLGIIFIFSLLAVFTLFILFAAWSAVEIYRLRQEAAHESFASTFDSMPGKPVERDASGRLVGEHVRTIRRMSVEVEEILDIGQWMRKDKDLGISNVPNGSAQHQMRQRGQIKYDIVYKFDHLGRRISTKSERPRKYKNYIALFGCSVTFGYGINESDTLGAQLALLERDTHVYNYGVSGTGPNHTLALISNRDLKSEIAEESGVGIFTFIEDQIPRVIGNSHWTNKFPFMPFYSLVENRIVYQGNFAQQRPWVSAFYRFFSGLSYVKDNQLTLPLSITEADHKLTCLALKELQVQFENKMPNSKFFITIPPMENSEFVGRYEKCFSDLDIRYISQPRNEFAIHYIKNLLSNESATTTNSLFVPFDDHPSGAFNREIAANIDYSIRNDLRGINVK
jgi:hypothetical protein